MRAHLAILVLLAAACSTRAPASAPGAGPALSATDVFPLESAPAQFADSRDPALRTLRVERSEGGARFILDVPGAAAREIRVTQGIGALFFSSGTEAGTELIRDGALPGEEWASDGRRVRFDGWERCNVPAGSFEAARITARRGPAGLEHVETWWLARGVGLVRLRSDRGGLQIDELVRTTR